jgi:hypothetical protein
MDHGIEIYVMCVDGMEWEDIVVFLLTEVEALEKSKLYPKARFERFRRSRDNDAYCPTYGYYQNGSFTKTG